MTFSRAFSEAKSFKLELCFSFIQTIACVPKHRRITFFVDSIAQGYHVKYIHPRNTRARLHRIVYHVSATRAEARSNGPCQFPPPVLPNNSTACIPSNYLLIPSNGHTDANIGAGDRYPRSATPTTTASLPKRNTPHLRGQRAAICL